MCEPNSIDKKSESEKLLDLATNLFILDIFTQRLLSYITYMEIESNKVTCRIPRLQKCFLCNSRILFKSHIKAHIFSDSLVYIHDECYNRLEESFNGAD